MKRMIRYAPWAAFTVIVAIAAIAVLGFDFSAVAQAHSLAGNILADAAAGAAATEELVREFKSHHEEVKAALSKAGVKDTELEARMGEIEQRLVRRGDAGPASLDTWGAQVERALASSPNVNSSFKGRVRLDVKATITSATTDADGSAGDLVAPDLRADVIQLARRRLRIRQLFPQGRTSRI